MGPRAYTSLLRRRRAGKTDYRARRALLLSRLPFATVRLSGKNVLVQIGEAGAQGDQVVVAAHSRELLRHGWQGSRKNLPAAYLTGLLAGYKARRAGIKAGVLYTGPRRFAASGRVAAALKGLQEAGLVIPAEETALPKPERLYGEHIGRPPAKPAEPTKKPSRRRAAKTKQPEPTPVGYRPMVERVKDAILHKLRGTHE